MSATLDMTLLRVMKYRSRYEQLIRAVPLKVLDTKTRILLLDFGKFFASFPDYDQVRFDGFWSFFMLKHPNLTEEATALYDVMLRRIDKDVAPEIAAGILERLVAAETAYKLAELVERWNTGDEVDLYAELRGTVEAFEKQVDKRVRLPRVTNDPESLLQEDEDDSGLRWRLDCLNDSMRPIRAGDFIVVAGRPDKGKTTFFTDQLSFMAQQLRATGQGPVLWFNNEGPGKRIFKRWYQSALNLTIGQVVELNRKGGLRDALVDATGGLDAIEIYDIHDYNNHEVEDIIKRVNPGLILFDMIDNIQFSGNVMNGGARTDQLLEAQYQWARVLGVKYDVPVIGASQISAEGDGLAFPTLSMLKDSKTGKQGAADAIITLGSSNDPALSSVRWIGMTKNKLAREGGRRDPRAEVMFDGERGRYVE